ncbi:MAG: galactonate dehydratase [Dysgonamonadaceae bacterium]|jgi:galactonate dehydratase|nr:galactonate dehydratase [Dysgonamonadaceae bacterium]
MKIDKLELFKIPPRWLFLKITTDDGFVGWGEPVVEGRADTVEAAVKELSSYLIGKDASRIEDIWQILYRGGFYRGGPVLTSAISGIDEALWDIKGKVTGLPIHDLLGGAVRDKIMIYQWIGGDRPADVIEAAKEKQKAGMKAVKMNGTEDLEWIDDFSKIDEVVERVAGIREACGKNFGIGIDFHGRVHKTMAKVLMKELEVYRPLFIEEPVLAENGEYFKMLSELVSTPIATGERHYTRWDFKRLFEQKAVDIIQPDVSHAGGITECKKIASMAEAYDISLAPHCPLGPIAFAACLQLDFNCVNAFIQETSAGIHYNVGADLLDYMNNPEVFDFKNGYIDVFTGPGLGIDVNEEKVREMAKIGHNWKNPLWRTASGIVAEW